mgnify:CR=1 FL=1
MPRKPRNSVIDSAAQQLREKVLASPESSLLGSEESLIAELGVSRSTVRQVARLLEREGLLRVKRGIAGGYYGARPSAKTIEASFTSYLETVNIQYQDVTVVSSALWVEVVRRTASLNTDAARAAAEHLRQRVTRMKLDASFQQILELEQACRQEFFTLIDSAYIEMIFNINTEFAVRRFLVSPSAIDHTEGHREFVRAWRDTRLLELSAVAEGDVEMGVMAAKHLRHIWHNRIWSSQNPDNIR